MNRLLPLLMVVFIPFGAQATDKVPAEWLTWTESHDFRSTGSYDETVRYLKKLETALPEMKLTSFGTSGQGRDMPLVIVSRDHAFTPAAAAATGKPIILIQNGIHAGEIDGKDASLMILRDMALGRGKELLDSAILLILPIYNVDGHERVSPYWRPAQNGPVEGMGFRANAAGLDLNRDHLKLDSLEARHVIELFNRWRPHLHVDNHVTNGAHHDWVLTYAFVKAPQASPPLAAWVEPAMDRIVEATRNRGHSLGPYVDLLDYSHPKKGFSSYVGRAWYATGYYPLRNVPSILVENHAPKPYKDRVLTNRAFLEEIIREVNRDPDALMDAVVASMDYTTGGGFEEVTLAWARDEENRSSIQYPGRDWNIETSSATGNRVLLYDDSKPRSMEVPWVNRARADKTAPRPLGYLIQPGWTEIEERIRRHDLEFVSLTQPATLEVDTLRVSNSQYRPGSYQGRNQVSYDLEVRRETRTVPAGTLFIAAGQPDFNLAVQLLEPDSPDSMASWGMMASALEWKEYISPPVLEPKVRK
ncbi:MAG: M14 family metallopeptidase, partial [Acidobacteria bacterium]|nr:M14 family metallopeptidase [Candidatus Polarisedimenticola svalbardensis]